MSNKERIDRYPQRLAAAGIVLSAIVFSACNTGSSEVPQARVATEPQRSSESTDMGSQRGDDVSASASTDPNELLSKGMAYADFRAKAMAAGWRPVPNPNCKANLLGDKAEEMCAKDPKLTACTVCNDLPELESCSGDAHCLMRFSHPDVVGALEVTGYGEVKYWKEAGDDPGLQITAWELVQGGAEG